MQEMTRRSIAGALSAFKLHSGDVRLNLVGGRKLNELWRAVSLKFPSWTSCGLTTAGHDALAAFPPPQDHSHLQCKASSCAPNKKAIVWMKSFLDSCVAVVS